MEENRASHDTAILVFSKAPVAGQVKTRLIPALGATGACDLHARLLQRTLGMLRHVSLCNLELWWAGDMNHDILTSPEFSDISIRQQITGDLGQRMRHACEQALQRYRQVIIIGTDCAVMSVEHLMEVKKHLQQGKDLVITPAEDGGYVLIAMRKCYAEVFQNIAWSTAEVFNQTKSAIQNLQIDWLAMPPLWDVDRESDLLRLQQMEKPSAHQFQN